MERDGRLSLIVGSFVVLSMLATAAVILLFSAGTGIFASTYRLVTHFGNIQGLLPGAPVWLAGKEVGRVSSIHFGAVGSDRPVIVELRVALSVQERIRADSTASVQTVGLLGDSYVEVSVGSIETPILEDGAEIYALNPANLSEVVATGTRALENIATLAENLNTVVTSFSAVGGENRLVEVVGSLADIVGQIQEGSGLLHSLIYDAPSERGGLVEILEASARINSILEKIDRGEGTLGLFVNDPTLYDDLKTLLGGAQRSVIVRSLIRMSVDDGN